MSLDRVGYDRPVQLDDAVALLGAPDAVALAGGTDLINAVRLGHRTPSRVVDLGAIAELRELAAGDPVRIGAGVTVRAFRAHTGLVDRLPALADAAALLGGRQIQARATFGGNVCNASPAAELATPLLALGADALVAGPAGQRRLPLADLFVAPGRTALGAGELLVALELPAGLDGRWSAYRRLELRRSVDIALVGASCWLDVADGTVRAARIALGAVAPRPLPVDEAAALLVGLDLDDTAATARAARAAADEAARRSSPIDDHRASADYRRAMTAEIAARAVHAAIAAGRTRTTPSTTPPENRS